MRWLFCLWLVTACSSPPPRDIPDSGPPPTGTLPACETTETSTPPVLPRVLSTLMGTIVPNVARQSPDARTDPSTYDGEQTYTSRGYTEFQAGPGLPSMVRTEIVTTAAPGTRRSLAYFVLLSDFQLTDDESPARWAQTDSPETITQSAMRPQEGYLPRVISAMNRTLARIAAASRPFDIGIVTGDCADMAQLNELQWVIGLMDGAMVNPDSGVDNDPLPGADNDPKDPFQAVGFPGPWLYVPGNHDLELVGILELGTMEIQEAVGTMPTLGARDYTQFWAPVTVDPVPADPMRLPIHRDRIVAELTSAPVVQGPPGHGYQAGQDVTDGANYTYDLIPGVLRIVVIDTNDTTGGSEGMIQQPLIDNYLEPALRAAEDAGLLVMLASHHSTTAIDNRKGQFGGVVANALLGPDVEQIVANHPNVIAWLVGHTHRNRIRAVQPPNATGPGYWEIMTAAIADWPSQSRIIELVDDGNGQLSIYATTVDYDADTCMERRYRRLGLIDYTSGWSQDSREDPGDENSRMIISVPFGTEAALAGAQGHDRIESETSLAGH